jgi:hypothetical protein
VQICNHSVVYKSCGMGQCNQSQCTTIVTPQDIAASVLVAKMVDVVVVNVAVTSTEGYDRDNLSLGAAQVRRPTNRLTAATTPCSWWLSSPPHCLLTPNLGYMGAWGVAYDDVF